MRKKIFCSKNNKRPQYICKISIFLINIWLIKKKALILQRVKKILNTIIIEKEESETL